MWRSQFLRNVLFAGSGTAISHVLLFATLPLLAKLYTPNDFGVFALYTAAIGFGSLIATLQFDSTILIASNSIKAIRLLVAVLYIAMAAGGTAMVLAISAAVVAGTFGIAHLPAWTFLLPIHLTILGSSQAIRVWRIRIAGFAVVSKAVAVRAFIATACSLIVIAAFPTIGSAGLIVSQFLGDFALLVVLLWGIDFRRILLVMRHGRKKVIATSLVYRNQGSAWFFTYLMSTIWAHIPVYAITAGFGATSAGYYSMAERISFAPSQLVSQAIADVFRQRAADMHRSGHRFDRLFLRVLLGTTAVAAPCFLLGASFAPTLFAVTLGGEWRPAGETASIILIYSLLAFIDRPVQYTTFIFGIVAYPLAINSVRLSGELTLAAVAAFRIVTFHDYLLLACVWRSAFYVTDMTFTYFLSRRLPMPT